MGIELKFRVVLNNEPRTLNPNVILCLGIKKNFKTIDRYILFLTEIVNAFVVL